MKVVAAILTIIISVCLSEDMFAQSFEAVLFTKVQREEVDSKIIFESTSDRVGQYENVNLNIIDNDIVLRFEYGEADAAEDLNKALATEKYKGDSATICLRAICAMQLGNLQQAIDEF